MLVIREQELEGKYHYKITLVCISPSPLDFTPNIWKKIVWHVGSAIVRQFRVYKNPYKGLHLVHSKAEPIDKEEVKSLIVIRP